MEFFFKFCGLLRISELYHEKLKYLVKSPKNENENSRSENISPRCLLVGLKNHAAKNIDFLNKNQCQKSAVINVSIIYFSHSTKGYLLQLKEKNRFPFYYPSQGF